MPSNCDENLHIAETGSSDEPQKAIQKQTELNQIRQEIVDVRVKIPKTYQETFDKGQYGAGQRWIGKMVLGIVVLALFYFLYTFFSPQLLEASQQIKLVVLIFGCFFAIIIMLRTLSAPFEAGRVNKLGKLLQQLHAREQETIAAIQTLGFTPQIADLKPTPPKKESKGRKALKISIALLFGLIIALGIFDFISGDIRYRLLGDKLVVYNYKKAPSDFDEALRFIESSFVREGKVMKWTQPVRLRVEGSPTDVDRETIQKLAEEFNKIDGFPGILLVETDENALIHYAADSDEMNKLREETDVDFFFESLCIISWGGKEDNIHSARILMQPHSPIFLPLGSQGYFNTALLHECYHMIGFVHSTREDSIMKTGVVFGMDDVDILAFKMVYNPAIPSGISFSEFKTYYETADIETFTENWGS